MMGSMASKNWMQGAVKNPGGLHRALGIPQGQKIPAARLAAAKNSTNPRIKRMANLAATFNAERPKKAANKRAASKRAAS